MINVDTKLAVVWMISDVDAEQKANLIKNPKQRQTPYTNIQIHSRMHPLEDLLVAHLSELCTYSGISLRKNACQTMHSIITTFENFVETVPDRAIPPQWFMS